MDQQLVDRQILEGTLLVVELVALNQVVVDMLVQVVVLYQMLEGTQVAMDYQILEDTQVALVQ